MKRLIIILAVAVLILVIWERFSGKKSAPKELSRGTELTTNSILKQTGLRRAQHSVQSQNHSPRPADNIEVGSKKLSRQQVEVYLLKANRSPQSLLNAFDETGDTNFLAEAVKNFSDDPMVQFKMLYQKTSPEERKNWIEKFKTSSPINVLPHYLAAQDYLTAGNVEAALSELNSSGQKTDFSAFNADRVQSKQEMYLLSGYSVTEAKSLALNGVSMPVLASMKGLGVELVELQKSYRTVGDKTSMEKIAALGIQISEKTKNGDGDRFIVNYLVGDAIQKRFLDELVPETFYDFLGETAGERIEQLKNERQETLRLIESSNRIYEALSDSEKIIYLDRSRLYGDQNAMRWLKQNYSEPK